MTDKTAGFYGTSTIIRENLDYYVDRAEEAATNAEASETAAAQSETNAATSASSAMADASSASTSASNAQLSADQAETARLSAEQASSTAQQAAINADVSATDSANSATASATSAGEALASENKAQQWAEEAEDVQVETGQYSAKHWAAKASAAVGLEWGGIGGILADQTDLVAELSTKAGSELVFQANRKQNDEMFAASGMVHFGKHGGGVDYTAVNQGISSRTNSSAWANRLLIGRDDADATGESKTNYPVVNIAGVISNLSSIGFDGLSQSWIKFPDAPDGTVTYDSATGTIVQHADAATAFAAETATNKVVTERVDHFGLEGYLEEVTVANPYVYPNGLIQSQATTMNGIATSASARPVTYYAVFGGDTTSAGLGVNFWLSSLENQKLMLNDPDNNLFVGEDGKVYQFRIRQRTIAGAGNGDWGNTDPNYLPASASYLYSGGGAFVFPQGIQDSIPSSLTPDASNGYYVGLDNTNYKAPVKAKGVFGVGDTSGDDSANFGVNGECYWLPLGTVPRLNQGAFHPSFNRMGTKSFGDSSNQFNRRTWYSSFAGAHKATSKADCFNPALVTANTTSGRIGEAAPSEGYARPDERFYDAIYADGQGGVDDYRLSAWGMTVDDILGEVDSNVKNGSERGLQKLVWSKVIDAVARTSVTSTNAVHVTDTQVLEFSVGDIISVMDASGLKVIEAPITQIGSTAGDAFVRWDSVIYGTIDRVSGQPNYTVATTELNLPVSGEFTQTEVQGAPADVLATPDLTNGWLGNWNPNHIPDGSALDLELVRKSLDDTLSYQQTDNNGTTWSSGSLAVDTIKNSTFTQAPTGRVLVRSYKAHSYITEDADNAVVYQGTEGLGDVFASNFYATDSGCLLNETLTGKVSKSNTTKPNVDHKALTSPRIQVDGRLPTSGSLTQPNNVSHVPVTLGQPDNNSPAVKALTYVSVENGQVRPYYAYKEMVWDFDLDNARTEFVQKDSASNDTYVTGTYYYFTAGNLAGTAWLCTVGATHNSLDTATVNQGDRITDGSGSVEYFTRWDGNGWGDDNLIDIADGRNTKTDLNGNTVVYGTARAAKPSGWIKNNV